MSTTTSVASAGQAQISQPPASAPSASFSPPPNNNNPATSGSTYYFGFLVAFLAFLFLFLSLGLLARRRRMHLMREMMLYGRTTTRARHLWSDFMAST
ncbi:unnamed protein product [Mycena citricolor]|uniref:Uncharacterized protein n=1 Tax=Mycena citricolor TaxID=2018698 RepID=A0AAD2GYT7_9AGAR|nr:unnamed protein product [Mycena citricolor]